MSRCILFLYVETPLLAGTGRGLGAVDLPIQRERSTGYPMIQASGIKGRLRAELKGKMPDEELWAVFGPEKENAADYAGAVSFGDARLLLFPVRSLAGVFAWVTSVDALERFQRNAIAFGLKLDDGDKGTFAIPESPASDSVLIAGEDLIPNNHTVVLEEFSFTADDSQKVTLQSLAKWLQNHAFPQTKEYEYWRKSIEGKLCVLSEDAYRDFTLYATEVQTHIAIDPDKKTVLEGALWTSESLPIDSLLYLPLMSNPSRHTSIKWDAATTLQKILKSGLSRINFGGNETTGQGFVALKFDRGEI
jgi:CRISPR-associated protein Cmr4